MTVPKKKKQSPNCLQGIVKMMEVEKKMNNLGRIFLCCTKDCGYFDWNDGKYSKKKPLPFEGQSNNNCDGMQSSPVGMSPSKAKAPMDDLLKSVAELKIEEDVEISFNITIRKGKGKLEDIAKEKRREEN
ncbi:uncharacterized protein LOC111387829 [Olea europaea var. sylvestris]|uniref:uncharacterized protein LOC111387829 n=1 Tax=Olea europaea var. sylvestris TaxID=158386 RepID=UPI000C1D0A6D|nr:uncharacterized protein LOC111387829 [Olea europaea var. sylvestris]